MDHLMEIDTDLVDIKDKSKIEIYNLLSSTGSIYLPPSETTATISYIFRNIETGNLYKLSIM